MDIFGKKAIEKLQIENSSLADQVENLEIKCSNLEKLLQQEHSRFDKLEWKSRNVICPSCERWENDEWKKEDYVPLLKEENNPLCPKCRGRLEGRFNYKLDVFECEARRRLKAGGDFLKEIRLVKKEYGIIPGFDGMIPKNNIKETIKLIEEGKVLWLTRGFCANYCGAGSGEKISKTEKDAQEANVCVCYCGCFSSWVLPFVELSSGERQYLSSN